MISPHPRDRYGGPTLKSTLSLELLERDAEIAAIASALEAASSGSGAVVAIEGAAGVGKTRLLEEARTLGSESGMLVLAARASELEREYAFGVVQQLFGPPISRAAPAERERLLAGAARLAGPIVVPGSEPLDIAEPPPALDASFPSLHGLYWLTYNLCERSSLLLAVDDAHWMDAASLRFLRFLVTRVEELPLLLAVAYRTGETGTSPLAELAVDPLAQSLRPAPLSSSATAELVRTGLSPGAEPAFCHACHEASRGNPFLLHELVRELAAEGVAPTAANARQVRALAPASVARAVLVRLARLGDAPTTMARAVAVLGDGAELAHAAALAGLEREEASRAADALTRAAVLAPGRPLAFFHPLVRSAVYSEMETGEQAGAHERAAVILEASGARPEQLAAHMLASEPAGDPHVVEILRSAGRGATARGAQDAATAYLRRALAEPPRAEERGAVLYELGTGEAHMFDPAAVEHLRAAIEASEDAASRAAAARGLGVALMVSGRPEDALAELDHAAAFAAEADRELALGAEAELLATGQVTYVLSAELVGERLARLGEIEGHTHGEQMLLGVKAFEEARANRSAAPGRELAERALREAGLLDRAPADSPVFWAVTFALEYAGSLELAAHCAERAVADARARGSAVGFVIASTYRSYIALQRGSVGDAEAEARAALSAEGQHGPILLPRAFTVLIDALLERAELEGAESALRVSGMADVPPGEQRALGTLGFSRANVRLAQGRFADALADLRAFGQAAEELGYRNPSAWPYRSRAGLALHGLGEHEEARRLVEEELAIARPFGVPRHIGIALRALGPIAGGEEGIEALREAVAVLDGSGAPLEHARALTDLGAALRRANRRAEAREPLRAGLELARRCGATAIARRAHEELEATGERLPRLTLVGRDYLTPSERRICEMAARGMANREIAQALFLTVKTIESHLSHAYRKLDISSRADLPNALGG